MSGYVWYIHGDKYIFLVMYPWYENYIPIAGDLYMFFVHDYLMEI